MQESTLVTDVASTQKNGEIKRVIVIGASAGGFEAFKKIIADLPADFETPIFIVWHMSPDVRGVLPAVLNRLNTIHAAHAEDSENIEANRIYIAPPDHHLLLEDGQVRVTHGPKENRFRPAVDPLFRSAAYTYGTGVIGIVLSGSLDDGTAGLWTIKHYGGTAIAQDPEEAEFPSMPESAIREVNTDYVVPIAEIAPLLVKLSKEDISTKQRPADDEKAQMEIAIAREEGSLEKSVFKLGEYSAYACPECHGVLTKIMDGNVTRFRCHTGHAYSTDTLLAAISEKIEDSLYNAIRGFDESILLLNHIGDHLAEINQPKLAATYFKKAKDAGQRVEIIRQSVLQTEHLSKDELAGSENKMTNNSQLNEK
jgi:two-component system, chemotaxis family, protein-glutamate methylesterase/glutaminase